MTATIMEQVEELSPEVVREAIASRVCPWCGKGPLKLLAAHTGYNHGIFAAKLKDMALLPNGVSTASPELKARKRELIGNVKKGIRATVKGKKQRMNTYVRAMYAEKAKNIMTSEERSELAKATWEKMRRTPLGMTAAMRQAKDNAWNKGVRTLEHGSLSMYTFYRCRCELCKSAAREYGRQKRAASKPEGWKRTAWNKGLTGEIKTSHGTRTMYDDHKCRCELCSAAKREANARYRNRA